MAAMMNNNRVFRLFVVLITIVSFLSFNWEVWAIADALRDDSATGKEAPAESGQETQMEEPAAEPVSVNPGNGRFDCTRSPNMK